MQGNRLYTCNSKSIHHNTSQAAVIYLYSGTFFKSKILLHEQP